MANELKATVINLKSLSQNIPDPITVGAGDASGRKLRVIFTQEAAAQFTPNTKVYLSWRHQEKDIKGYNIFTEIIDEENEDFPPTWEISYPKSMLYEGHVLACIEIVDEISIATSVNFTINILIDPNNGKTFVESDDYTDFQNFIINLNTLSDQMQEQMINYENEFEQMQLDFTNFSDLADTVAEIQNQNEEIQNSLEGINLSEIQEFVENYEEPTLSLGDNDVTTNIIADKAVTLNKLSDEVTQKINTKNSINLIKMSNGTTVTVNDAYAAAPPLGLTVDGKSVQDGTPTPSSPVAIDSVESLTLYTVGKNLLYVPNAEIGVSWNSTQDVRRARFLLLNVAEGTTFTYSRGTFEYGAQVQFLDSSGWTQVATAIVLNGGGTFTVPAGCKRISFWLTTERSYSGTSISNPPNFTRSMLEGKGMQFEVGAYPTAYTEPQAPIATTIDLQGHELRSLPDGTRDELTVDADGHVTLVQRVGVATTSSTTTVAGFTTTTRGARWYVAFLSGAEAPSVMGEDVNTGYCNILPYVGASSTDYGEHVYTYGARVYYVIDGVSTSSDAVSWVNSHPLTVVYKLATPVTYDLGTINLPDTPAPDLTVWAATDPITNISLTYNRDIGIVINNIEEALNNLLNS